MRVVNVLCTVFGVAYANVDEGERQRSREGKKGDRRKETTTTREEGNSATKGRRDTSTSTKRERKR